MQTNWTNKKEIQLSEWKNVCEAYNHLHEKQKEYFKKKVNYLLIPTIIISSTVTVLSSIASSITNNFWLNISSAILAGIATCFTLYTKNDTPEQKIIKHSESSKGYREIVLTIESELAIDIELRKNSNDFIKEIMLRMLNLETGSESIPILTKQEMMKIINKKENSELHKSESEIKQVSSEIVNGLSNIDNKKFELFFRKFPSTNQNMLDFQLTRLDNV